MSHSRILREAFKNDFQAPRKLIARAKDDGDH
jgi:hypothetical protein